MSTQTITLSLSDSLIKRAEALAAQRHITVSRLLAEAIEELIAREDRYARARARSLALMANAPDLGTRGQIAVTREALHER
ncbi:MAG: CopG family transcriptional regulator [Chloroflexi bacterium]|nr:CopG family transcriptional regulator [Chloroflexota bacterium]